MTIFDPVLSCENAQELENRLLGVSDTETLKAMTLAGEGTAKMFLAEFGNAISQSPKILVLCGGGHNGGDALIAAAYIASQRAGTRTTIAYAGIDKLKKNTKRALVNLQRTTGEQNVEIVNSNYLSQIENRKYDVIIDGISGMNFRPPARQSMSDEIATANNMTARVKISIDIPSGASDIESEDVFRADATYATGICKDVIFHKFNRKFVGRIRYVNVGFFDNPKIRADYADAKNLVSRADALQFLNELRPSVSDKRSYGHLFIIAGSRSFPGAALLATHSALRAGVGLVTAFVPETVAACFAAVEPSAIWVGCPEDESGAIALESLGIIRSKLKPASAILAGSGITNSPETRVLLGEVIKLVPNLPIVLDADAICEPLVSLFKTRSAPALITPHEGEILRLAPDASDESLLEACKKYNCTIALKSGITRVSDGEVIVRQVRGNPTLARAGSGDILSGISGAMMANKSLNFPKRGLYSGVCASQCLGMAAEKAFFALGETTVATSDIATFIPDALGNPQ